MHLNKLLNNLDNPINNFKIALFYESKEHYSPAACFYLRCADRSSGKIRYESIIRACICYNNLGARNYTQEVLLKQSISELYKRQEAYFLLCQLYEKNEDWINCYLFSKLALVNCKNHKYILKNYEGICTIKIYNAISCWHLGKTNESFKIFIDIIQNYKISDYLKLKIQNYMIKMINNY